MEVINVSVAEFCTLVGVKKTLAHSLIRSGQGDVVKLGSRTLITVESINRLIERSVVRGRAK